MKSLEEVSRQVRICTDCPLSEHRTNAVPGEGPANASIMLIGEGPGFHEDKQGRPFVGASGRFLDQLIVSAGLKREELFIANVVKCRPPNNRDPQPEEIAACRKYLDRQIGLINPKVVVTLGRYSMARFFPNQTIGKIRGKARNIDGRLIYPMYHPAAALHNQSLRTVIEEDFKAVSDLTQHDFDRGSSEKSTVQQLKMFSQDT